MTGERGNAGELKPGTMLGQYRIVRLLGRGGMGEVYLVEHAILTTRHALKLLPSERSAGLGFVNRFHDEARVMAKLIHPGIVHVTHADVADGRHYLVMDFVAADTGDDPFDLEDALSEASKGRLPPEVIARLGTQICTAVQAAHAGGVVHRDLKPANVLLTRRDLERAEVRVTDFGLARLLGEDWVRSRVDESMRTSVGDARRMTAGGADRSHSDSILGTYEYMSPEQRAGRDVDERSDIFSLGVMLYRMITGKGLVGRARAASKIVKGLDETWDELIDACLEEEPSERPATMREVGDALRNLGALEKERKDRGREAERRRREAEQHRKAEAKTERRKAEEAAERAKVEKERRRRKRRSAWPVAIVAVLVLGALAYFAWTKLKHVSPPGFRPLRSTLRSPAAPRPMVGSVRSSVPQPGRPWTVPDLGMEFMPVSSGSFKMGSNDGDSDEEPVHTVRIARDFWLGKYEVTQAEYEALTGKNPSHFKGARNPVETVSWEDASAYCAKLTARERSAGRLPSGYEYRLPTEAEWEYAARGGTKSKGFTYAGSEKVGDVAWYSENSGGTTHAVGGKGANEVGLYDMSGNVWEWCLDWYDEDYYEKTSGASDPVNMQRATCRVKRGGSWFNSAGYVRSASRGRLGPSYAFNGLGFRVCLAREVR